jgi:S1-C subfamily serine protease
MEKRMKRDSIIKNLFSFLILLIAIIPAHAFSQTYSKSEVIEKVKQSVVWIHSFGLPSFWMPAYDLESVEINYSTGSGYVVSDRGIIITNHHVIEDATGVVVYAPNYNSYKKYYATVLWSDKEKDLAILKCEDLNLTPLALADPEMIKQGDEILVLGYPGAGLKPETMKVTAGIISNDPKQDRIQVTAPVNSGNSGGPVVNMNGEVVGTAFAHWVEKGVEGVHFVIPSSITVGVFQELLQKKFGKLNYLGTEKIEAYKKLCEAEESFYGAFLIANRSVAEYKQLTEEASKKMVDLLVNSIKSTREALNIDENYAQAHYFLASYFLQESLNYCLNNNSNEASNNTKYFIEEMNLARRSYLIKYQKNDIMSQMYDLIKNSKGEFPCEEFKLTLEKDYQEKMKKVERKKEWERYLENGEEPKILKEIIDK